MTNKPLNRAEEIAKIDSQINQVQTAMSNLTQDEINKASVVDFQPQTEITRAMKDFTDAPVIKPIKSIPRPGKPIAKEAKDRAWGWEYVRCIAENREVIGETIELWTGKYHGDMADFWQVPVNRPIYLPRHVAKRISECRYHRVKMQDRPMHNLMNEMESTGVSGYSGQLTVVDTRQRLDCRPIAVGF